MKQALIYFSLGLFGLGMIACEKQSEEGFRRVPASESGVTFKNTLSHTVEFNIFNYMYFYNGGGVAIGDVNGDGLPDIYFTANQESNKLYLNKGNLRFHDVTEAVGVGGFDGWTTGVTMVDINGDARLDIYVSYLGDYLIHKGKNQLFVNEGNDQDGMPRFTDRAMEYGLDLVGFSTQAAFFDYDRDGDLDMFMLNHSVHDNGTYGNSSLRKAAHPLAGDKLLRNDNGRFVEVTRESGIFNSVIGYGLGVVISDVNVDGWPDIYVGNDFHENDYLYMNQGDGTFVERLEKSMMHTSRYTMGVDFADLNNDAFPDLMALDMLPKDPTILKQSQAEDQYDIYNFKINFGYNHQFSRNTLQLNNQDGTFSDIALMAGVAATDWSWASLIADFDLDGNKDIFVSNGIPRRPNDLDYINFVSIDSVQMKMQFDMTEKELAYIEMMPQLKISNCLFINNNDSTFSDMARAWGLDEPSFSNGAAYGDLDNDGDLDLVVNNIEDEAFIYENRTISKENQKGANKYLGVTLNGKGGNRFGLGAKVLVYDSGRLQMQECMATRGFQSAVDTRLIFGVDGKKVDSLKVIWNDGSLQTLYDLATNKSVLVEEEAATEKFDYGVFKVRRKMFRKEPVIVPYRHKENLFVEFNREPLIPHMLSREGPAVAIEDINGDGRQDIFLGGSKWNPGEIFFQTAEGKFVKSLQPFLQQDSTYEDVDAIFFDADGDKDKDLFVVSGGNEFGGTSKFALPRLYVNDGNGKFETSNSVPPVYSTGACVAISDIDMDGDQDVFLGARTTSWRYGIRPDSYILINDGKGNFTDATDMVAPFLRKFGFVKKASWADMDGDSVDDLIIAAEWRPISIALNKGGKLAEMEIEKSGLENSEGWWNILHPVDIDNDGDVDLIAGNLGTNSKLKASSAKPVRLFAGDFDNNDSTDQLLTSHIGEREYLFHTRDELVRQMPVLKKQYLSYKKFAATPLNVMFPENVLEQSDIHVAYTFESSVIENLGGNRYRIKPLPNAAQFSTINAVLDGDFDHDGNIDVLVAGNFYPVNIQLGRNDASYGLVLRGRGSGNFSPVPAVQSGFSVKGEVRALRKIRIRNSDYFIAIRNSDSIQCFTINPMVIVSK